MRLIDSDISWILAAFGWSPHAKRGDGNVVHLRGAEVFWSDAPGQEVRVGHLETLSRHQRRKLAGMLGIGIEAMAAAIQDGYARSQAPEKS